MPETQPTSLNARTFLAMGTVVSLSAAFPARPDGAAIASRRLDAAVRIIEADFATLEDRFSLFREDSEASALARGVLRLANASAETRAVYTDAIEWRRRTHGSFTPERPDGVLDLSGIVKARAIAEAGRSLVALGLTDWCLNAGGDVLVSGTPSPSDATPGGDAGRPWLAGVVDPDDRRTLLGAYPLAGAPGCVARRALATSGSAERGDHIWAVGGGSPEFVQVSVAAGDIETADVLATAIVAGGREMLDLATAQWDVDVLAVTNDGGLLATPGFRAPRAA
ncbi:FAD:protein FMN transferase [Sinomonas terrae]|uniref:FAD:protein FMN transferase n=1 Tax=Sinomonas terrae TaxID=2908838 RepID=A0ABS9TWQ5_9MICC|nr:FAD:protein FMN transferase [Sinomonas terrae]MCH6468806.1 FAD:protein FMN transferase [Sinomonas terrae]